MANVSRGVMADSSPLHVIHGREDGRCEIKREDRTEERTESGEGRRRNGGRHVV